MNSFILEYVFIHIYMYICTSYIYIYACICQGFILIEYLNYCLSKGGEVVGVIHNTYIVVRSCSQLVATTYFLPDCIRSKQEHKDFRGGGGGESRGTLYETLYAHRLDSINYIS